MPHTKHYAVRCIQCATGAIQSYCVQRTPRQPSPRTLSWWGRQAHSELPALQQQDFHDLWGTQRHLRYGRFEPRKRTLRLEQTINWGFQTLTSELRVYEN